MAGPGVDLAVEVCDPMPDAQVSLIAVAATTAMAQSIVEAEIFCDAKSIPSVLGPNFATSCSLLEEDVSAVVRAQVWLFGS